MLAQAMAAVKQRCQTGDSLWAVKAQLPCPAPRGALARLVLFFCGPPGHQGRCSCLVWIHPAQLLLHLCDGHQLFWGLAWKARKVHHIWPTSLPTSAYSSLAPEPFPHPDGGQGCSCAVLWYWGVSVLPPALRGGGRWGLLLCEAVGWWQEEDGEPSCFQLSKGKIHKFCWKPGGSFLLFLPPGELTDIFWVKFGFKKAQCSAGAVSILSCLLKNAIVWFVLSLSPSSLPQSEKNMSSLK